MLNTECRQSMWRVGLSNLAVAGLPAHAAAASAPLKNRPLLRQIESDPGRRRTYAVGRARPVLWLLVASVVLAVQGCGKSKQEREAEMEKKMAAAQAKADAAEKARQAKADAEEAVRKQAELKSGKQRLLATFQGRLKDPDSVQYREPIIFRRDPTPSKDGRLGVELCGQYNAKNGFGGYGGFHTFYVHQYENEAPVIFTTNDDEPFRSITRSSAQAMGCS